MRDLPSPAAIHQQQADAGDWIQSSGTASDAIRYSSDFGRNGPGVDVAYSPWDGILQGPFAAGSLVSRSVRAQWVGGNAGELVRCQPANVRLCTNRVQGTIHKDAGNQGP